MMTEDDVLFLQILLGAYLIILAVMAVLAIISYVVDAIIVSKLHKKVTGKGAWLAWVPFSGCSLAVLSESLLIKKDEKAANLAKWVSLGSTIVGTFLLVIFIIFAIVFSAIDNEVAANVMLVLYNLTALVYSFAMLGVLIYTFVKSFALVSGDTTRIVLLVLIMIFLPICKKAAIAAVYSSAIDKRPDWYKQGNGFAQAPPPYTGKYVPVYTQQPVYNPGVQQNLNQTPPVVPPQAPINIQKPVSQALYNEAPQAPYNAAPQAPYNAAPQVQPINIQKTVSVSEEPVSASAEPVKTVGEVTEAKEKSVEVAEEVKADTSKEVSKPDEKAVETQEVVEESDGTQQTGAQI